MRIELYRMRHVERRETASGDLTRRSNCRHSRCRSRVVATVISLVTFAVISLCPSLAHAAEQLRGSVIGFGRDGTVVVRHRAFGVMPAMTMAFRVPTGTSIKSGDRIRATSLSDVRVEHGAEPAPLHAVTVVAEGQPVPDTLFLDQRARPFRLRSLRGSRYALSFMYTRCRDPRMCPLVSAQYAVVQRDATVGRANLVDVTLDPTFDRPAVLARYGRMFGADARRWHLLTGDPAQVLAFARLFGVQSYPDASGIVHTERTAIVNADGRIERFLDDAQWTAPELVSFLNGRSGAWQRVTGAPAVALRWCGEHIGAGGRTVVHHTFVVLIPIVFLVAVVGVARFLTEGRTAANR